MVPPPRGVPQYAADAGETASIAAAVKPSRRIERLVCIVYPYGPHERAPTDGVAY